MGGTRLPVNWAVLNALPVKGEIPSGGHLFYLFFCERGVGGENLEEK